VTSRTPIFRRFRAAAKTSVLSLLWSYDKLAPQSQGPHVAVLNYHDVDDGGQSPFTVRTRDFASQIRGIHRAGFSFLRASDFQRLMAGQAPASGNKWVLLTFDDGYAGFETHVVPVLREYDASAIVFIHTDRGSVRIQAETPVLDWDAIDRINTAGFEIGNHSHTHRSFRTLSNAEIDEELDRSETILKERTGRAPRFFAFPGGDCDGRTRTRLLGRGYDAVFGGRQGRTAPSSNPMDRERICVGRETSRRWLFFALRGALDRYEAIRRGGTAGGPFPVRTS
jgi:peptidoglycan/xylan/chitin deacetylase (PgdA/CDA1 family)